MYAKRDAQHDLLMYNMLTQYESSSHFEVSTNHPNIISILFLKKESPFDAYFSSFLIFFFEI